MTGSRFENHLKDQKSPYLKQHAFNPVDWYPWSGAALAKAKEENRPLIISIGYSSCHWCHVMERESFEDPETARIMNDNFVNIKVDREERPDLDSLYIKAVQAMTGHAGWPLTVFATPEGVPFYGGSYFPPEDRFGMPSFKKVLLAVSLAYRKNRKKVDEVTVDVERILKSRNVITPVEIRSEVSDMAFDAARLYFDGVNGGFGRGTKFPHTMFLKFLLAYHRRTGRGEALTMVRKSLSSMARGGIYDQLGGGFHRYSVDERWDVPHFEKMLYDNALFADLYTEAFEETGKLFYKDIALETIGYMLREMKGAEGGFYSSQDADVSGHEGAYYLWSAEEIKAALGDGAERFMSFYSVTERGNYEDMNTLRISRPVGQEEEPVPEDINAMREALFKVRAMRKAPETDRKIITSWNGLAIMALSRASKAFGRPDLLDEAEKCAAFLLTGLRDGNGRVMRYFLDGGAEVAGLLEDYALLGCGLLSIHKATGEEDWLEEAGKAAESMVELFHDEVSGLFFDAGADQEKLFVRERDLFDNDVPSGNSAAAQFLLGLSRASGNARDGELAEKILRSIEGIIEEPISHGNFLAVLESFIAGKEEHPH
jgi:uncharacterized protein YyaL (SSP411 family)